MDSAGVMDMEKQLLQAGITASIVYAAAYALRSSTVDLKHFKAQEFGLWWPLMDTSLLLKLDEYRERLGAWVAISPAPGAIGRAGAGHPVVQRVSGHPPRHARQ